MRKTILGLTVGFVIMMLIAIAQARTAEFSLQKVPSTVAEITNNQASIRWTVVAEKVAISSADEPEKHFQKARESFLKKNAKAAAAEIRKGAALLKLEASHATKEVKETLMASSRELEKLAKGVEGGTVNSTQELRRAFAHADRALAKQHYQTAAESWSKKEIKKAGHELKAAANDVEMAMAWAGHKLEATSTAVLKDARAIASKLIEETRWTTDEVGKGLDAVGEEIEELGKRI